MSNRLRDAVWENGPTDPTMTLILMSICGRANEDGYCWPSHDDTAKRTGYSRKTVKTATKKLVDAGWIRTEVRYTIGRERSSNGIYVNINMLFSGVVVTPQDAPLVGYELPQVGTLLPPGGVAATPESFIESVNEIKNDRAPLDGLREHFVKRTTIQPNDRTGTYDRNWKEPLEAILAQTGNDAAAAAALIDAALDIAWGKNGSGKTYPVASPRSIATIAANLTAAGKATTTAADDETIWQRALNAISRKDYSDDRLKAAIRAIGGSGRIASANGHETDQLRRQLANEYRRIPTPA